MQPMKKLRRRAKKTGKFVARKVSLRSAHSRFEADKLERLVSLTAKQRIEIELSDARGKTHVISLPLPAAVELGYLICDASEAAPYLVGGVRRIRK